MMASGPLLVALVATLPRMASRPPRVFMNSASSCGPKRDKPKTESAEPRRPKDRSDREEPRARLPRTDSEELMRAKLRIETDAPK